MLEAEIKEGMLVRVDTLRLAPFIGRVTYVHTEQVFIPGGTVDEPNGIVRVEVTEPLRSHRKVGALCDVGTRFCYPQTED